MSHDIPAPPPSTFHRQEPDYTAPRFAPDAVQVGRMQSHLRALYGEAVAASAWPELLRLMQVYYAHKTPAMLDWEVSHRARSRFTERDAILITYGDLIQCPEHRPLQALEELASRCLKGVFSALHILPFYPYSSDRGFAVIDFKEVDARLGTWDDILRLRNDFHLMFDGVFNHVSSQSPWFREFLNGNPDYADFFTVFGKDDPVSPEDLKRLFRPRTSSVLTSVETLHGPKRVWTTFSPDQIDLKFQNPRVLLCMVDVLLHYVMRGAELIRLDAVTYLWDELGGTGVHLDQTHRIIKLFRDVLDAVAPHVVLITETNVPHQENVSYFGNGHDEAQMVYNFALPPLMLHTFQTENCERLAGWAGTLAAPSAESTFLNFFDSHDGIGVLGARGILSTEEVDAMIARVVEHGGLISYKQDVDGSETPYEMNITSYSAINRADAGESTELQIRRYLAARSIALVLPGVPGIYLHGLLGSSNDVDAVLDGGEKRGINRRNLDKNELFAAIDDTSSVTSRIARGLCGMLKARRARKAFHPCATHRVFAVSASVLVIERAAVQDADRVLCLTNVSSRPQTVVINDPAWTGACFDDLLSGAQLAAEGGRLDCRLDAYQVCWLAPTEGQP